MRYGPDHAGMEVVRDVSGLEVVPETRGLYTAYGREEKEASQSQLYAGEESHIRVVSKEIDEAKALPKPKRGRKVPLWALILVAFLAVIVVIAVVVPVVLKTKTEPSSTPSSAAVTQSSQIPSSTSTATAPAATGIKQASTSGAFNGTGIALIGPRDPKIHNVWLFYQHFSGQIRRSFTTSSTWKGGTENDIVVADNVKNGTPITAGSFWAQPQYKDLTFQVVYIDKENRLRDMLQVNDSGQWKPGNLGSFNFFAANSSTVGLNLCYSDAWKSGEAQDNSFHPGGGVKVYYGGKDGRVHEISKDYGSNTWVETYVFPPRLSPCAGLVCFVPNNMQFLFGQAQDQNELVSWWRNNDVDYKNSSINPINLWTEATPGLNPPINGSSMAYGAYDYLYFQDPDNNIRGVPPNLTAGTVNAEYPWGAPISIANAKGMPNTQIGGHSGHSPFSDNKLLRVYFQQKGNDIVEYIRDQTGGVWAMNQVPVG